MKNSILPRLLTLMFFSVLSFCTSHGAYLETFSTADKGYKINLIDDFTDVNWTLSPWATAGGERDASDYFNTTAAGKLECIDLDQQVYWESPQINISNPGTVTLSLDLTWVGFDTDVMANNLATDWIKVQYSVDGGAYTTVPNVHGGTAGATVAYPYENPGASYSGNATVNMSGITGSTLKIRVVIFTNVNGEITTIDNVSVPQAGVFVVGSLIAPTVTGISPSSGSTLGGTSVTITGTDFTGATAVTIGGSAAAIGTITATSITATTPAHAAGAVNVSVTTLGGIGTGTGLFTYVVPNAAPTDITLSNASIAENNAPGVTIGTLMATDANGGDTHTFTLVVGTSSADNMAFTVTGNTLTLNGSADFETKNSYTIRVRATDSGTGSLTFEKAFTITITDVAENVAPVAGADGVNRPNTTQVAKVLKTALLVNDSDADPADILSITAVGSALPAGAAAALVGNFVVYTAPAINSGNGSFTYTLSDGAGGHTVTGTVTVTQTTPGPPAAGAPNAVNILSSGPDFIVTFLGVPGNSYRVQYTVSAGSPYSWSEFIPPATYVAPANTVFSHTDVAPPESTRLYRAVSNP